MSEQFLVHLNRTLSVSLRAEDATLERLASFLEQREGVPCSLLDFYVNGRKLEASSHVPTFPCIVRARLRGGLRGGKGGFGAMLRSMGKSSGAKAVTDFGACRDLHGRRLRHVNQEVALQKWHQDEEARMQRAKDGVEEREMLDEETPSGIPGWYLATPSWAEKVRTSYMKRRRNTVLCKNWVRARENGTPPPDAPLWWGCPRGRNCDFAHGQAELRGQGLSELKRVKRQQVEQSKQQELQKYVHFEQELPQDVLDAIKSGLRRRKIEEPRDVLPTTTHMSVRSTMMPLVEQWLQVEGDVANIQTFFKHGLCELRGRGNFGTAAARHCCSLKKGKWYYEVCLVTAGVIQIGWADSNFEANSEEGDGVGDHDRSWAYDGARQVKWNSGKDEKYAAEPWSKNDVIGCLLDLEEGTMSFTRNGVDLGVAFRNVKHTPSDAGFFPAISVEESEILLVNIGSQPFMSQVPGYNPVIIALEGKVAEDPATNTAVKNALDIAPVEDGSGNSCAEAKIANSSKKNSKKRKLEKAKEIKNVAYNEPPIDLMKFETVESLEALGLERLKQELSRRGLKCGGTLTERAARLDCVRGKTWQDIDTKLKANKGNVPLSSTTQ